MHATLPLLIHDNFPAIKRKTLETLQVNLGYKCNQSCLHCHVNAGLVLLHMGKLIRPANIADSIDVLL